MPKSAIARAYANYMFNFNRNKLYSQVAVQFYIPTTNVWVIQFLHIPPIFGVILAILIDVW